MKFKKSSTRAFTLIDILVSVSIISFLSSIVMFNVTEGRTKAQDAQMKIEAAQVATAVEMFKLDNDGKTPISVKAQYFKDLGITPGEMYPETDPKYDLIMKELVDGGYIAEIPTSPDEDSYAYGETTDGTQAMFVAELSSLSNIENNNQNSCDFVPILPPVPEEPEVVLPCLRDIIPIILPSPTYNECTYQSPTFTSTDLPDDTYIVEVTNPAYWSCDLLEGEGVNCWVINEGDPIWEGCDVPGYTWTFQDGISAKLCPAPQSSKAYSCVGTYYNPPPCESAPPIEGYTCTNIDEMTYELCPTDQGGGGSGGETGGGNLCDGTDGSDYCTCI